MGDVFQQAVALKQAQLAEARKRFEASPRFVKDTLAMSSDGSLEAIRALPAAECLARASEIKQQGNADFGSRDWDGAYKAYARAAACVRYYRPQDKDWRTNSFSDDTIDLVHTKGDSPEEERAFRELLVSCYLNIAQCRLSARQDYDEALAACNEALDLDPSSAKAYFRRARSRYEPASCGATELAMAVKDLAKAAALEPGDATIRKTYAKLLGEHKRAEREAKETLAGLFDRSDKPIYGPEETGPKEETEAELAARAKLAGREVEAVRDLIQRHRAAGRNKEAERIERELHEAEDRARAERLCKPMDWSKPTAAMKADAAKKGIDLDDPKVLAYMQELEDLRWQNGGKLPQTSALTGSTKSLRGALQRAASRLTGWRGVVFHLSLAFLLVQVMPLAPAAVWAARALGLSGAAASPRAAASRPRAADSTRYDTDPLGSPLPDGAAVPAEDVWD